MESKQLTRNPKPLKGLGLIGFIGFRAGFRVYRVSGLGLKPLKVEVSGSSVFERSGRALCCELPRNLRVCRAPVNSVLRRVIRTYRKGGYDRLSWGI